MAKLLQKMASIEVFNVINVASVESDLKEVVAIRRKKFGMLIF